MLESLYEKDVVFYFIIGEPKLLSGKWFSHFYTLTL